MLYRQAPKVNRRTLINNRTRVFNIWSSEKLMLFYVQWVPRISKTTSSTISLKMADSISTPSSLTSGLNWFHSLLNSDMYEPNSLDKLFMSPWSLCHERILSWMSFALSSAPRHPWWRSKALSSASITQSNRRCLPWLSLRLFDLVWCGNNSKIPGDSLGESKLEIDDWLSSLNPNEKKEANANQYSNTQLIVSQGLRLLKKKKKGRAYCCWGIVGLIQGWAGWSPPSQCNYIDDHHQIPLNWGQKSN